jgi:putative endonuclease
VRGQNRRCHGREDNQCSDIKQTKTARSARKSFAHASRVIRGASVFYVYVLRSETDSGLYIGYTRNLRTRIKRHNSRNSFATAHRSPLKLIYYEAYLNQVDALGRERYLKSGASIIRFADCPFSLAGSLAEHRDSSMTRRHPHKSLARLSSRLALNKGASQRCRYLLAFRAAPWESTRACANFG